VSLTEQSPFSEATSIRFLGCSGAGEYYRSTGVGLFDLRDDSVSELDLFGGAVKTVEWKRLFQSVDAMRAKFGKHTLYLGSSHLANRFGQHLGERGDEPARKGMLLKGETKRRRLGIPMFLGEVG
jgi:hypothetical protein